MRLLAAGALLGLIEDDPDSWFRGDEAAAGLSAEEIDALIEERNAARKAKDFAASDKIRDDLKAKGIVTGGRAGRHDVEAGRLSCEGVFSLDIGLLRHFSAAMTCRVSQSQLWWRPA